MEYGYLLKVSNKNIYREVEIPSDIEKFSVGVNKDNAVRFYKDSFAETFEIRFEKKDELWMVSCSDNIYFDTGDVRKVIITKLSHGDSVKVRYQSSELELFDLNISFDFYNIEKGYNRSIEIPESGLAIGGMQNCNVILESEYAKGELVVLRKAQAGLILDISKSSYGIFKNGKPAKSGEIVKPDDFLFIADYSFVYKNEKLVTSQDVKVSNTKFVDEVDRGNYPKFTRNTRIKTVVNDEKIEIMDPPAVPQKPKNRLLQRLLPSIVMVGTAVAMGVVGGSTMFLFSAISGLMGVVTAVVTLVEDKKDFKKNTEDRITKYTAYIEKKKNEIETLREEEKTLLNDIYIDLDREVEEIDSFSPLLFDRKASDDDFLDVRVGTGSVKAKREISYRKQEKLEIEDDLQLQPELLSKEYEYVDNAPVVCRLKEANAVGISGNMEYRKAMLNNMVIDICARQYYTEVMLFIVAEEGNKEDVWDFRFLPHFVNQTSGYRNIACNDESKAYIFEYLYKELTFRKENKVKGQHLVVFFYDEYGFRNHPISRFVDELKDLGVTFIFFEDDKTTVPQGCSYLVDLNDKSTGVFIDVNDNNNNIEMEYQTIPSDRLSDIIALLAPVYTEEVSLESSLTKSISMFQMLNILAVDDIDLERNWAVSQVFKSMAAPIGVSKTGIVNLDLHDKAHGPHGLVAGTTGSGKSEVLQTYILSIAALFHPYEVGFVIIDFKGGGMANQFEELPHLMGAITNIDGKEINRSLKSIKAELKKRQRLFAEADVNHIDKYIKKFKAGEVDIPLPHLIVIVDEFAELKADQPEFMKELISAARIGRSLGVHLILATQKPAGQVDDQIWSNSRFKLCLKVQDQADSNEVIKSPLAAEIKEPGRAYFQVGNNEIFELVQSAYSGAPEFADESNVKEFSIAALNDNGKKEIIFQQKKEKQSDSSRNQLDAMVDYISSYCEKKNISKLPDICLPSLSKVIDFPESDKLIPKNYELTTEIGIYDAPDNQFQGTYSIDLAKNNVMIIGSSQSGKTNLLQTMIRSIATKYSPEEATIYIIDFASRILKNFETLNHVGGTVTSSEDEKLKNLFKLLFTEIEMRKEKLMQIGVSSFTAYKEAGKTDLPQIILMIDNLTALKELYFEDDDDILSLCREGLTVGITVVIANSQTAGIGYKYLSNFSSRIALYCNDSSEYSSIFDHCRETIDNIPGRCLVEVSKEHLDCQTYLAFEGDKEIERVSDIRKFISNQNEVFTTKAKAIPEVHEVVTADFISNVYQYRKTNDYEIAAGIDFSSVSPFVIKLNNMGSPLAVTGREGMGRSNFIRMIIKTLDTEYKGRTNVYVIDNMDKKLEPVSRLPNVEFYDTSVDAAGKILPAICNKLESRYDAYLDGELEDMSRESFILIVINNKDAIAAIENDYDLKDAYEKIRDRFNRMNAAIIVGDIPNAAISYSSPEILRDIRDAGHFMVFEDISLIKITDVPLSYQRVNKKKLSTGDGFYFCNEEIVKLKTVIY